MKKITFVAAIALIFTLLFSSCATIFTGTTDTIRFNSDPQGATVYIDGVEICKTPCTYDVPRSLADKQLEVRLDGYEVKVLTLSRKFNTMTVLNIFNGLVGWAIDAATGAMMQYSRKGYDITLTKKIKEVAKNNPSEIHIDTVNKVVAFHLEEN
ncbi:PEGA domain-containing protein [Porphyromonas sp.]|uniref:PEGA domain-containing protein n=1 Tax=Porphyromonas sp. TaxID=1924944 RepID=UPI0026DB8BC4|nr:PEGA domain-containing protein [Porphyromonas sp.]MDO4695335.1 PEGA domain-containing protein [Porphyromonas sp.]MDO4771095.1 PEGA domain-containing protein [Porphyromonas sp.]